MGSPIADMKVLIAEDDKVMCDVYRIALLTNGHIVTITYDGRECIQVYKDAVKKSPSNELPFDVVVLDYRMPDIDGLEAAREILKINKTQRIIFASSYVKETLIDSVKHLEQIVELIQKPFEPKALVELVEDTSATKHLEEINKMVANIDPASPNNEQIDQLLEILKKIQKVGFG